MASLVGLVVVGTSGNALADGAGFDWIDVGPPKTASGSGHERAKFDDRLDWFWDIAVGVRELEPATLVAFDVRAGAGMHGLYGGLEWEFAGIAEGAPLLQPPETSPALAKRGQPADGIRAQATAALYAFAGARAEVDRYELALEVAGGFLEVSDIDHTATAVHGVIEARARMAVLLGTRAGIGAWFGKSLVRADDWTIGAGAALRFPYRLRPRA